GGTCDPAPVRLRAPRLGRGGRGRPGCGGRARREADRGRSEPRADALARPRAARRARRPLAARAGRDRGPRRPGASRRHDVSPDALVPLARRELDGSEPRGGGVGAGPTTCPGPRELEREVRGLPPPPAEPPRHVGNPRVRNRGTFGGSLAHADPAAELPVVAL